jgi:hypothetical protein
VVAARAARAILLFSIFDGRSSETRGDFKTEAQFVKIVGSVWDEACVGVGVDVSLVVD